ncbi:MULTISPECIES: hypothetical protein [Nostocales]|uniref:Uncharacterized protein n=2 Tax=Nostocales TaxID=1161 RepID=A0ABW8WDJ5_9CYAN|nr:hypothetical protein [Tolypothrix bouteillei]
MKKTLRIYPGTGGNTGFEGKKLQPSSFILHSFKREMLFERFLQ